MSDRFNILPVTRTLIDWLQARCLRMLERTLIENNASRRCIAWCLAQDPLGATKRPSVRQPHSHFSSRSNKR